MKKLIIVIAVISIMLSGCGGPVNSEDNNYKPFTSSSFVKVEDNLDYEIVYHKDTKVMYIVTYKGGYTVMVDENGTPLLWED